VNSCQTGIKKFKLSEIYPAKYNPRQISKDAFEGLRKSIAKFGCVEPIIVNIRDGKNIIVGGHQLERLQKKVAYGCTDGNCPECD